MPAYRNTYRQPSACLTLSDHGQQGSGRAITRQTSIHVASARLATLDPISPLAHSHPQQALPLVAIYCKGIQPRQRADLIRRSREIDMAHARFKCLTDESSHVLQPSTSRAVCEERISRSCPRTQPQQHNQGNHRECNVPGTPGQAGRRGRSTVISKDHLLAVRGRPPLPIDAQTYLACLGQETNLSTTVEVKHTFGQEVFARTARTRQQHQAPSLKLRHSHASRWGRTSPMYQETTGADRTGVVSGHAGRSAGILPEPLGRASRVNWTGEQARVSTRLERARRAWRSALLMVLDLDDSQTRVTFVPPIEVPGLDAPLI